MQFEPSGKIKPPIREELKAADEAGEAIIVLDRGTIEDGTPYWAYVAVRPSRYEEFMRLGKNRQPKRINDYGAILKYGFDAEVPYDVRQFMEQANGFDDHFEEKLAAKVKTARIEFLKQQESQRISDIVAMLKKKQQNGE